MASVTVTLYVPSQRLAMVAVTPPLLQAYWYGARPPVTSTTALPLQRVEHVGFVPWAKTNGRSNTVIGTTNGVAPQPVPVGVNV